MRRFVLATAAVACFLLLLPAVVLAEGDDDIPGTPITVGFTVIGVIDGDTDLYDAFSVRLVSGEQVQLDISDPTTGPGSR